MEAVVKDYSEKISGRNQIEWALLVMPSMEYAIRFILDSWRFEGNPKSKRERDLIVSVAINSQRAAVQQDNPKFDYDQESIEVMRIIAKNFLLSLPENRCKLSRSELYWRVLFRNFGVRKGLEEHFKSIEVLPGYEKWLFGKAIDQVFESIHVSLPTKSWFFSVTKDDVKLAIEKVFDKRFQEYQKRRNGA